MASVLLAVGDKAALSAGDTAIKNRLETTLGHTVTLMSAAEAVPGGTFGTAVLTQSGSSASYGTKFTALTYPVLTLNTGGMLTQLNLATTNSGTRTGTTQTVDLFGTDQVNSGLPDPLTVWSVAQTRRGVTNASLAAGVINLANIDTDTTRSTAGVAESGATATTGTFPARRGFMALEDAGVTSLSADGWTWFDHMIARLLAAPGLSVTASSNASTILTTGTATLTASVANATGSPAYSWTKTSGPAATFGTATASSTSFTPTGGAGTYVLRCTVTDSASSAYGEVTVTVSAPSSYVTYDSITVDAGWTATGGTSLAVLTDASGATYVTSSANPTNLELTGSLAALTAPAAGQPLTVLIDCDKLSASTGSIVAKLYEGATLRSTVTVSSIPDGNASSDVTGQITVNFPDTDIAAVTSWADLTLTLLATTAA